MVMFRQLLERISITTILILMGLLPLLYIPSQEAKSSPLELRLLDLEYHRLDPDTRDPYVPEYTGEWKERVGLNWNVSSFDLLYWNNYVHTETVNPTGRVKTVGWKWELGLELFDWLQVFHSHHSRHVMEEKPEDRFQGSDFPVEDSYGIRITIFEKEKK